MFVIYFRPVCVWVVAVRPKWSAGTTCYNTVTLLTYDKAVERKSNDSRIAVVTTALALTSKTPVAFL